ncbi:DNA polymerase [Heliophilum fasciatum]|uniref:DNA polymerase n=1 Tax=Heliophilum fasciatum TaxID=35700 RepID=UPI001FAAF2DE|nr:DNA polymerase [Heliophilum fasciatum]MCW2279282.1 DNA polymerase-1 [Heliophilum fasciatum]
MKKAIEAGEIGTGLDSNKTLTKTKALEIYRGLMNQRKTGILREMVEKTPTNYRLIQTVPQLRRLVEDLERETFVALDTETTGLNVYQDEIVGLSLSLPVADYHVYIPVAHKAGKQLDRDLVLEALRPMLTNPDLGKVLHNAKFDIHMLIRHGVRMKGLLHDTRIAMALLNENETSYALKNLATKYGKYFGFQEESHTFDELFGKTRFDDVALDVALVYAAKDTHLTLEFYKWQKEHLQKRDKLLQLHRDIENVLVDVCVDMEQTGLLIDREFAAEYGDELRAEIVAAEAKLKKAFGDINFNSPSQLAKVFYDDLKLPDNNKRSTDVKTLKALQGEHDGIKTLLEYRGLTKLLGTYVDALPEKIQTDGRLHGSFNQVQTVTGRFSSNDPNLQNLPPKARKLVIAPKGMLILGSDFSQIEPRILAHLSGDEHFREPYLLGQDLYSTLASRVFKVPIEECRDGSIYRKKMKIGLLAVMYGTSMFTLSQQLGISIEEAQEFIRDFFTSYPGVHKFILSVHESVKKDEFVETIDGRKRRFSGHREQAKAYDALARKICSITGTAEVPANFWKIKEIPRALKEAYQKVKGPVESVRRQSVNAIIQGTAADVMKKALLQVHAYCKSKGWELFATVHDEALMLVSDQITPAEVREIENCMLSAVDLNVPMKVDTELMKRWGEGIKKSEWFNQAA